MYKKNLGLIVYFLGLFVFTLALTFTIGKSRQKKPALASKKANFSEWRRLAFSTPSSNHENIKPTPQSYVLSATDTKITGDEKVKNDKIREEPKKQRYVIAAFGDSMVDTMGDSLDYLKKALQEKYPHTEFVMYNYGVGSENVEEAIDRLDKPFHNGNRDYAPLKDLSPDILILGSFAYNPLVTEDKNLYWSKLAELISNVKKITQNVYLLAEIGPLYNGFGRGPGGVNWPEDKAREQSQKIKKNLEDAIGLARATNTNLIDTYTPSLRSSGLVNPKYVNSHDNIHPSIVGHTFMARIIADTLKLN